MAIENSQYELFQTGTDFNQIHFLDNFHVNIAVGNEAEEDLTKLLQLAIKASNHYVKRLAFKLLADLTLTGKITNPYVVLAELQNLLSSDEASLQSIAIKYLPNFPEARTDILAEQLKDLSDHPNGDVASQAYLCLGMFQLTEAVALSSIEEAITSIAKAKPHFQAAVLSTENRIDAEFYLLILEWLETIFSNNPESIQRSFEQIERNLMFRDLYEFSKQSMELDFLVFRLTNQIRLNFKTSSSTNIWLEVKPNVQTLLNVHEQIRRIKNTETSSQFLIERLFSNVFENIENEIYQVHLSSNKERLKALSEQEEESPLAIFLYRLIANLPESGDVNQDNPKLLALLSDIAGSEKGLNLYNGLSNKSGSSEVLEAVGNLARKYKGQQRPIRTGSIRGQEVFDDLKSKIKRFLPDYPEDKLEDYFNVVEEVIRYAHVTFVGNDRSRFPFLYTKTKDFLKGKGQNAKEQDLQDSMLHFFEHSKIMDGLEHEKPRFVDGGRVDILYSKDLITIPIELKKSKSRPSKQDLENNYIAQAQTYTAGYDQLGVFVLLEMSEKANEPQANFKDWFGIHHLPPSTNLEVKHPDYIISLVIPGNRTSPSSKSTYSK